MWALDNLSYALNASSGTVEQRLSLITDPLLNLAASDLGVLGCGIIFHGLSHSVTEKWDFDYDNGTCSAVFSQECGVGGQGRVSGGFLSCRRRAFFLLSPCRPPGKGKRRRHYLVPPGCVSWTVEGKTMY